MTGTLTWTAWGARAVAVALFVAWTRWVNDPDVVTGALACAGAVWLGVRLWRRWRAA